MRKVFLALALSLSATPSLAGSNDFSTGPIVEGYGPAALVESAEQIPADLRFKIAFDAAEDSDDLNRTLVSAARFLNMHGKAGVDSSRIDLAVVIHGGAVMDILSEDAHKARKDGATNLNASLVAALQKQNVRIILCGQTAAYREVTSEDLLRGVEVAISAMTAHAQLQQNGYTLNPF